jgi:hypothetical protein
LNPTLGHVEGFRVAFEKKTSVGFSFFSLVVEVKANLLQYLIFGDGINLVVG